MADKVLVSPIGNGEYRITLPQPIKFDMKLLLDVGTHKIRVLSPDESREMAIGIEGEKETLLSWLRSMGVDQANIESYEEAMTDQ